MRISIPPPRLLEKTGHNGEAVEFLDQLVKSAPWEPSYRLRLAKATLAAKEPAAAQAATEAQASLASIASGPTTPYDLRLKAAVALAGRPHSDLGGGELNLLAGPAAALTAAAADKFYFYNVRIRAAQNVGDAKMKIQLLSHCVIDFPRRDEARVPLFQAAVAAQAERICAGSHGASVRDAVPAQRMCPSAAQPEPKKDRSSARATRKIASDESSAPATAAAQNYRARSKRRSRK